MFQLSDIVLPPLLEVGDERLVLVGLAREGEHLQERVDEPLDASLVEGEAVERPHAEGVHVVLALAVPVEVADGEHAILTEDAVFVRIVG